MKRSRITESDSECDEEKEDNDVHVLLKFITDESVDVFVQSNNQIINDLDELNGDSGT